MLAFVEMGLRNLHSAAEVERMVLTDINEVKWSFFINS